MVQPAITLEGSSLAHLRTVSPNACFQCNRSTVGCPLPAAMDLTPAQIVPYLPLGDWGAALLNPRTSLI
jgi:heterodisulfide reductase subunit C